MAALKILKTTRSSPKSIRWADLFRIQKGGLVLGGHCIVKFISGFPKLHVWHGTHVCVPPGKTAGTLKQTFQQTVLRANTQLYAKSFFRRLSQITDISSDQWCLRSLISHITNISDRNKARSPISQINDISDHSYLISLMSQITKK